MIAKQILFLLTLSSISITSINALTLKQKQFFKTFALPEKELRLALTLFPDSEFYRYFKKRNIISKLLAEKLKKEKCTILKIAIIRNKYGYRDLKLIFIHPTLPDYVIKLKRPIPFYAPIIRQYTKNIGRVVGAHFLKQSIISRQIKLIEVPQKYLFHLPDRPEDFDDRNYAVFVKKLNYITYTQRPKLFNTLTKQQYDDLFTIMRDVGYHDANSTNICLTPDCKFLFLDTEIDNKLWRFKNPFRQKNSIWKTLCFWRGKAKFAKWNPYIRRTFPSSWLIKLKIV